MNIVFIVDVVGVDDCGEVGSDCFNDVVAFGDCCGLDIDDCVVCSMGR